MSTELVKNLLAVRMMSGVTLWFPDEKVETLKEVFAGPRGMWPAFVEVEGQMFNPSSVEGIYTADVMERETRVKQGQWMCKCGEWHARNEKCEKRVVVGYEKGFVDGKEIQIPIYGKK